MAIFTPRRRALLAIFFHMFAVWSIAFLGLLVFVLVAVYEQRPHGPLSAELIAYVGIIALQPLLSCFLIKRGWHSLSEWVLHHKSTWLLSEYLIVVLLGVLYSFYLGSSIFKLMQLFAAHHYVAQGLVAISGPFSIVFFVWSNQWLKSHACDIEQQKPVQ